MQAIKVSCTAELRLPLDELIPIQGELKILTAENYEKLKKSILTHGFKFPMFVWKEVTSIASRVLGGKPTTTIKWYVLDGHGRRRVLMHLRDDGYEIPLIPCVEIVAESLEEAKKMVLLISSSFHTMTKDGLHEYLVELGVDATFLDDLALAEIDVPEFKAEFYEDPSPEEEEPGKKKVEFDAYQNAAIKQVVLYFASDDYQKILAQLERLMKEFEFEDYSQVVWKLVNERISA